MQTIEQLQHAIARIHILLNEDHHDDLAEMVRHYAAGVHALCNDAQARPCPESLRQLAAWHRQVMDQMRQQRRILAHTIASRRHCGHAARTYLSASA